MAVKNSLAAVPSADQALAAWWQAPTEWLGVFTQNLWALQRAQFETFAAWQQVMTTSQQEWWDEWAAHWAGGAPIN